MTRAAESTSPPFRYRLAAVDIDDTLVGPDKRVSDSNRAAIARLQAHGCRVVLASGREHSSMRLFAEHLELDDYLVSSQGALVEHPRHGDVLWHRPVDPAMAVQLVEVGLARGAEVLLYTRDGIFAAPDSRWVQRERRAVDRTLVVQPGDLLALAASGPLKVLWYGSAATVALWAPEMVGIHGTRAEIVITAPALLEFNAPDATKATAVAAVARHYDIARDDVVAFGDGLNDVAMLRWAGCGVAVGHAMPEARDAADIVVGEGDASTSLARGIAALFAGVAPHATRPGAVRVGP